MQRKLNLLQKLQPDEQCLVNLSLNKICRVLAVKHTDADVVWDALHDEKAFGNDFFLNRIEREYSNKLMSNLDGL